MIHVKHCEFTIYHSPMRQIWKKSNFFDYQGYRSATLSLPQGKRVG